MTAPTLHWLPRPPRIADWRERVRGLAQSGENALDEAISLANFNLTFSEVNILDAAVQIRFDAAAPKTATPAVRLAVLASSTSQHLVPAIRMAGLRRGIWIDVYVGEYGQYVQELLDPGSALHKFAPTAILFAFDAAHLCDVAQASAEDTSGAGVVDAAIARIVDCWKLARDKFGCRILQQTPLNTIVDLLGNNERRGTISRSAIVSEIGQRLRPLSDEHKVDLVGLDRRAELDGLAAWHSPVLWCRTKQDVHPVAAPCYGDLVVRILAAQLGRSAKCLVLDLDNTLWGGVVGDDGLNGLILGQGSALGEGFTAFQTYAKALSERGVILAVCSKNDEANALEVFEKHPEMVLKRSDIACFVANWQNKADNLREIAQQVNIGIDSLVFFDDNVFERTLVRSELPMVAVPEFDPEEPVLFSKVLADAGYFESLGLTKEDFLRKSSYAANIERDRLRSASTDLGAYLRSLKMELTCRSFDEVDLPRIVQLINKTNQFNLMTRRYSEDDVRAMMQDPQAFGLHFRLSDVLGDNGIIAIVIGRSDGREAVTIDTWLMSCRVLGRGVEEATLACVADAARGLGAETLIGQFRPTAKNGMVAEHYPRLGFEAASASEDTSSWTLDLRNWAPAETSITIKIG